MAFALTEEQSRAVHDRGGGLLVSAAAGSGKTRVLVERLLDRVTGEGADIDRLLGHHIYPGGCGRAAGPDCSGAVRSAGGAAQRPAPAPADHAGLQGPDLHGARLLCRSAAGERPPARIWTRTSGCATRGRAQVLMARVLEEALDRQYEDLDSEGRLCRPGGHHGRRAGRQPPGADRAGRVRPHPEPPGPGGLAGRPEPPVGAGWGHRRGGHPLGGAAAGRRQAAGGALPGAAAPGAGTHRPGQRAQPELRPQSLPVHPGGAGPAGGGQLGRRVPGPASGVPSGGAEKGRGGPGGGGAGEGTAHPLQEADGQAL